jgi:hypothetical protein
VAIYFSVPAYIPDVTSGEVITGYNVQSLAPVAGNPQYIGTWETVSGSPFSSNINIFDPNGTSNTVYQIQPIRQVVYNNETYTIDTPWSRPILPTDQVYDAAFTRALMPSLRFTYLNDQGTSQSNGTEIQENIGAGNGLWIPNGDQTRFPLQYVMNDDPIRILENVNMMTYIPNGTDSPVQKVQNTDYWINERSGWVEFAEAPAVGDYIRLDFRRVDFLNQDLYLALTSAINTLSTFGLNGYQINQTQNLLSLNQPIESPDLAEIICHTAIYLMREGLTEAALRSSMTWRDGGESADPFPSRGLQFIVGKLQISEDSLKRKIGNYIRVTRGPQIYGEYETFWNLTELTPLTSGMFGQMAPGYGWASGLGVPFYGAWM